MPNLVTNKVKADQNVIKAMLNEKGFVDFNKILPFKGSHDEWDSFNLEAEYAALEICSMPPRIFHENNCLREKWRTKLGEQVYSQLLGFIENYRECGYINSMAFNRAKWGTKWNACKSEVDIEAGTAKFDTAWSCPGPVLLALSKAFPNEPIEVTYADEDIGSNCGTFVLKNGEVVSSDIAPGYHDQTEQEHIKWRTFAYGVKGWEPEPEL